MAFGVFFDKFIKLVFKQTYIFVISKNKNIKKNMLMDFAFLTWDLGLVLVTHPFTPQHINQQEEYYLILYPKGLISMGFCLL
jgi:hypothetical protein